MSLSYFGYFRKLFNACLLVFIMELPVSAILTCTYSQLTISVTDTTGLSGFERDLFSKLENKNYDGTKELSNKIEAIISSGKITDKLLLSDGNYLLGLHSYTVTSDFPQACRFFEKSASYREEISVSDARYAKCLTNLGVSWFQVGNFDKALEYGEKAILVKRRLSGNDSTSLVSNYLNLASINLQLHKLDEALLYAEAGLSISKLYPEVVPASTVADLYQDISLCLYQKGENAKALMYAKQALELYAPYDKSNIDKWVSMFATITQIYEALKQPDLAEEYYRLGLKQNNSENIRKTAYLTISYVSFLEKRNQLDQAESVLLQSLNLIKTSMGVDNPEYSLTNASYASILYLKYKNSNQIHQNFAKSFSYLNSHSYDKMTRDYVLKEYGTTLYKAKLYRNSISILDKIIENDNKSLSSSDDTLNYNKNTIYIIDALTVKYLSLNALAHETGSRNYTHQAIKTGELLTSIFDQNRLEMSEDESRIKLSDTSRFFYTGLIENYCSLYTATENPEYLEKAFELSEKSKVSGFLAATRQVNATRFSVPAELSKIENNIRKQIGLYREYISKEKALESPDSNKISIWEKAGFSLTRSRDSLVDIFEKDYPDFYKLKYNSAVASLDEVSKVIGKEENLLSYVMTDSRLFIFIINKDHREVIIQNIDPAFNEKLARFQHIISTVPEDINARAMFNEYMYLANDLYEVLLAPAEPLLIGRRLTISPDNILAYIPFETLLTNSFSSSEILYRDAPYVLKKYRLSYIYSVTLSSETKEFNLHLRNKVIAFAPSYDDRELSDSILLQYPDIRGTISSLPYATEEATDVIRRCGGTAYIGRAATEEIFKQEASKFDIIHLAMHTLVNDQDPSYSKMVFSRSISSTEDNMLNTYEVYNIPLNARMVVLSSCNTGSGKLTSGEGIQSLARGFIFSGGHSVVTSMWEVEDYAGFEVIKMFYKNLIKGNTKSEALQNARLKFLDKADQKRSHPYYWSTLVVYGDDSPLYFSKLRLTAALSALIVALGLLWYLFYKGPRS